MAIKALCSLCGCVGSAYRLGKMWKRVFWTQIYFILFLKTFLETWSSREQKSLNNYHAQQALNCYLWWDRHERVRWHRIHREPMERKRDQAQWVEWESSPFIIGSAGDQWVVLNEKVHHSLKARLLEHWVVLFGRFRRCPQPCWREDGIQSRLGEFNDCSTSGFPLHLLFSPSPLRFPLRCACDLRCEDSTSYSSCQGCFWLPCLSSTIVGSYPSRTVNSLFLELPLITEFY